MFEVAYSIDGRLKETLFSKEEDARKYFDDILEQNKINKDFEYINLRKIELIAHYHRPGQMMRGD